MAAPRLVILDLLLSVAAMAVGAALWIEFADNSILADVLGFASFLGLMTTAGIRLWAKRLPARPFHAGFKAFGVVFLVLGLRLGETDLLLEKCDIGMGYAFMAGVAARWVGQGGPLGPRGE
jgi:hypothetical protein